jgi:hypothetical protein
MTRAFALFVCACLPLAACGTSRDERALSGAAIGAGLGAVGAAAADGSPVAGAVLGGAAGAAAGVLLDRDKVDLGDTPDLFD